MVFVFALVGLVSGMVGPPRPDIVKCGTPLLLEGDASFRRTTAVLGTAAFPFQATHLSPSGRFRLEYDTTGTHAVLAGDADSDGVPDYVERAARYADESWTKLVQEMGYRDPVVGGQPYVLFFEDQDSYGYTEITGGNTRIAVHPTFTGFPGNDDPDGSVLGALKVTIAHELKHAIQYRYNQWNGPMGAVNWVEIDATATEEIVYPQVNDYVNYLDSGSISGNPTGSIPNAYSHATFGIYHHVRNGADFWVRAWEDAARSPSQPLATWLARAAAPGWPAAFAEMHLWHHQAGGRTVAGYGFPDAGSFPNAATVSVAAVSWAGKPDTLFSTTLNRLAGRHFSLNAPTGRSGPVRVLLLRSHPDVEAAFSVVPKSGATTPRIADHQFFDRGFFREYRMDISWEDLNRLGVVVANATGATQTARFWVGTTSETPPFRMGDLDGSGAVDDNDLIAALDLWTGNRNWNSDRGAQEFIHDLNGSGKPDLADAARLHRNLANPPLQPRPVGGWFTEPTYLWPVAVDPLVTRPTLTYTPTVSSRFTTEGDTLVVTLRDGIDPARVTSSWGWRFAVEDSTVLFAEARFPDRPGLPVFQGQRQSAGALSVALVSPRSEAEAWPFAEPVEFRFRVLRRDAATSITLTAAEFDGTTAITLPVAVSLTVATDPMNPVGVESRGPEMVSALRLDPAYPNPFNPSTVIGYRTSVFGTVRLGVYDVLGREVRTLVAEVQPAGTYSVTFDATGLASGFYLVRLESAGEVRTHRITLLK